MHQPIAYQTLPKPQKFTIRVYGLLIDRHQRLLVSDEYIRGNYFTKFPGGGLELGEGTRECLQREFLEETGLQITVQEHFYTTDFFQISAFNTIDQIISIYYKVSAPESAIAQLKTGTTPFQFTPEQIADVNGQYEVLRWLPISELSTDSVHLPIDKVVVQLLLNQ
ncbi:MAG: NUDIX domain-containing protein [Hydrotalea flava]|nr:NUDIX domain-containing protein [Hydrotalea flava]RTL52093.1 MAG: NUDIX domain-containing protein [Sphingobacteriales bacterium]NIM37407.1 NUDIX domain-containing protein [Hydrotalea flava]NIN02592.1 NUDIX domain-containing protein [Hydrotalea flava]NIN14252.1 NUDIX domain-containing protein [Hydrotalea flava]